MTWREQGEIYTINTKCKTQLNESIGKREEKGVDTENEWDDPWNTDHSQPDMRCEHGVCAFNTQPRALVSLRFRHLRDEIQLNMKFSTTKDESRILDTQSRRGSGSTGLYRVYIIVLKLCSLCSKLCTFLISS